MPTYEYRCPDCTQELEVVQSIQEPSLTQCPSCNGTRLRRVFSNVGVVFKGSGFYRTDSRGKPGAAASSTPAAASPGDARPKAATATTAGAASAKAAPTSAGSSPKAPTAS